MGNDRPEGDKATKVHLDEIDFAQGLRADEGWIGMKVQFLINEANSGAKEVVFGRTVFAPGSRHEWHRHENAEEIQYVISGQGIIEGVPPDEVNDMVIQLKAGALSVPLEIVQSRTVGPTLGQDSINRSLVAGAIGLGIVGLFMILFYRVPGVISVIALLIYTAMMFAIFKLWPITLTLAGIAGFILSIGMAVDANVLIFARVKEELHLGRSLPQAIELGFNHAWPSIRDSNITTMITTLILYLFGSYTGTSIITGFALTLFIGVAVSMFTAITVTRTLLRVLVATGLSGDRWWFGASPLPPATPAPAAD